MIDKLKDSEKLDLYESIKAIVKNTTYSITWDELLEHCSTIPSDLKQTKLSHIELVLNLEEETRIDELNEIKTSLLHLACKLGDVEMGIWLIQNHTGIHIYDKQHGNSPLHWAAQSGSLELVLLLIEKMNSGIINFALNRKNYIGETPLHLAALNGHLPCVEHLIKCGAEVSACNNEKNTPLHLAASNGHLECACNLIAEDYASVSYVNGREELALHLAVQNEHKDCIKLIIDRTMMVIVSSELFVNLVHQNIEGDTPWHLAAKNGNLECMKCLLLDAAGPPCTIVNKNKETPLHLTIKNSHYDCAKFLIDKMPKFQINKEDEHGRAILPFVILSSTNDLSGKKKIIKLLLNRSTDSNIDIAYNISKEKNDKEVLKIFEGYYLKQAKKIQKKIDNIEKYERCNNIVTLCSIVIPSIFKFIMHSEHNIECKEANNLLLAANLLSVRRSAYGCEQESNLSAISYSVELTLNVFQSIAMLTYVIFSYNIGKLKTNHEKYQEYIREITELIESVEDIDNELNADQDSPTINIEQNIFSQPCLRRRNIYTSDSQQEDLFTHSHSTYSIYKPNPGVPRASLSLGELSKSTISGFEHHAITKLYRIDNLTGQCRDLAISNLNLIGGIER